MSVLLLNARPPLGHELAGRLLVQDDEVRVVETDPAAVEGWRSLGVHVAPAGDVDADLVERAAQGCRSVVLFEDGPLELEAIAGVALEGATHARVERLIVAGREPNPRLVALLSGASLQFVVLWSGRSRLLKQPVAVAAVAEAIDAADDLGGEPKLELDLRKPESWRALMLEHHA